MQYTTYSVVVFFAASYVVLFAFDDVRFVVFDVSCFSCAFVAVVYTFVLRAVVCAVFYAA